MSFCLTKDASLYEASQEITYLDNVIQESLRLYPPGARWDHSVMWFWFSIECPVFSPKDP